jgi:hypothetical protein
LPAHPPPGERANKEKLMAEERDPGLDNQERPERDPMEQGYESSPSRRSFNQPNLCQRRIIPESAVAEKR